jgi:hypothetical protein
MATLDFCEAYVIVNFLVKIERRHINAAATQIRRLMSGS